MSGAGRSLSQDIGDPFGAAADPARYVAREATERALTDLERTVIDQESPALLVGVPGIGKTLLLRLLKRRLEMRLQVIHLPYAALPPAALANWALNAMQVPSSWDPVGALATRAHHAHLEGRGGILLLIDDADLLPEETARALAGMVRDSRGALRFVAAVDAAAAERIGEWLGAAAWVELVTPMTPAETFQYVHTRIHGAELPESAIAAFGPDALAALHERAGGIPGRVGAEATALLLRALRPAAPAGPAEAQQASAAGASDQLLESLFPDRLEVASDADLEFLSEDELRPAAGAPARQAPRPAAEGEAALEPGGNAADDEDAGVALARAAGRQALAQSGAETTLEDASAFERAAGLLALAHEGEVAAREGEVAPREGEEGARPGSHPAAPPAAARRRGGRRARLAVGGFVACFAIGAGVGRWFVNDADRSAELDAASRSAPEAEVESPPAAGRGAGPPGAEIAAGGPAAPPRPPAATAGGTVAVQINATPWARIRVDGVDVGVTPLAGVQLETGEHRFEAHFPDGTVAERVQSVGPGNRWVVFP